MAVNIEDRCSIEKFCDPFVYPTTASASFFSGSNKTFLKSALLWICEVFMVRIMILVMVILWIIHVYCSIKSSKIITQDAVSDEGNHVKTLDYERSI